MIDSVLESYLSELGCSGPLTGNKCPKIEWCGKWILDLLANKTCRAKEESHRRALVRCCVLPICLQQLHYQNYLSQFQWSERRTFLSNQCKIEMHYLYQISRMQLSFVVSLAMNSLKKTHLLRDVTLRLLFYSLKENWSDSVDTLRSLASLILSWNEKKK